MEDESLVLRKEKLINDLNNIKNQIGECLDNYDEFTQIMKKHLLVNDKILDEDMVIENKDRLIDIDKEISMEIIPNIK